MKDISFNHNMEPNFGKSNQYSYKSTKKSHF